MDKLSGRRQPSIPYALSHLGKPYDLVNVPEECPNLSNTCQVQNDALCSRQMFLFLIFRGSLVDLEGCAFLMERGVILVNDQMVFFHGFSMRTKCKMFLFICL